MNEEKYVLLKDVIIKKGTILSSSPNQRRGNVECYVEMGKDSTAIFLTNKDAIKDMPEDLITLIK